jgi:uncharacterized protein YndB with AHSA1/START domain
MPNKTDAKSEFDLTITRLIDAPRALVWQAWTNPELFKKWWAPKPFTTPECEIDVRPGGVFRTLMRGPDGTDYPGTGVFLEVVEHERVVFTNALELGWRPSAHPFFTAIFTMEDENGQTRYSARALHKDDADRRKHEEMGFHDGWVTCMKQLAQLAESLKCPTSSAPSSPTSNRSRKLKITTPSDREIVMTRNFEAPRALVWDALTKPELLKRWLFGPDGWSMTVCEIDLRVGGEYRYVWKKMPSGHEMGMGGVYREIVKPERIVSTEKFDDAWYAGEALGTAVLTERVGQTTLTTTMYYESKQVRDNVLKSPMEEGLEMGYARLENVLASLSLV